MSSVFVLQRFAWNGEPREVAIWWTLRRGSGPHRAICRMFTHQLGHELRLEVKGQLVESQVCRTDEDVLTHQERWRAALEAKGWMK
jgi:hypothetical protein